MQRGPILTECRDWRVMVNLTLILSPGFTDHLSRPSVFVQKCTLKQFCDKPLLLSVLAGPPPLYLDRGTSQQRKVNGVDSSDKSPEVRELTSTTNVCCPVARPKHKFQQPGKPKRRFKERQPKRGSRKHCKYATLSGHGRLANSHGRY